MNFRLSAIQGLKGASRPDRLVQAFAREERAGLAYALWGRLLVLAILAVWVLATLPAERSLAYLAVILVFAALGAIPHAMRSAGIGGFYWTAAFLTLDVALLTYVLVVPTPMFGDQWTAQLNLRLPNFLYLGVFLVGMALSYSPALVLWTGGATMVAWSVGVIWVAALPESIAFTSVELLDTGRFTPEERINLLLAPEYVALTKWHNQLVFLALVTLLLAIAVWRSRRLVQRQVATEAARANLSRYFSPNMVEQLAAADGALDRVDAREAAVMFIDIVGFTDISERVGPDRVMAMLRSFHRRMARTIFDHGGTVDKYIGDGIMANFGTPLAGPHDATNALRCAYAIMREVAGWNEKRAGRGAEEIRIGIGVHYGDVVTGNIGDERHLEYAVIGDTVNVANRLERLTRELGSPIVVSAELVKAVGREADAAADLLSPLAEDRTTTVRGRTEPVSVWRLNGEVGAGEIAAAQH